MRLFLFLFIICHLTYSQDVLQNVTQREKICLDGTWQVIIDPMENGLYSHSKKLRKNGFFLNEKPKSKSDRIEYDFDSSDQLQVPGDWNTQQEKLYLYEGTIWYKRSFTFEKNTDKRVFLYFEGVNYASRVYLNGNYLGEHVGGFTPFQFDVTEYLEEENFVIVKVDNRRKQDAVPTDNFDWWNYGGITRSVWLVETPETRIQDYRVMLDADRKIIKGWVTLSGNEVKGQNVEISIPELNQNIKGTTDQSGKLEFSINSKPLLWSPSNPKLYGIELSFDGQVIKDQIGFKTIETKGTEVLLNGDPIFLKGISIHEEAPFGAGRVTSKEQARILLNWAKELGCNFVRLAHYPHDEFMVREAERLGLLIWSEIPVYWTIDYTNDGTYTNAEKQLVDMISRDKNRVGIGLWSVANETPITVERLEFLKRLIAKARKIDGSRLITAALNTQRGGENETIIDDPLGDYIDVIGINSYCGWYSKSPGQCREIRWKNAYDKPMIMSEMGAGALQGLHGGADEVWTEEYQAEVYRCNIDMIENIEFMAGMSPWILQDFRSPRRHLKAIQADYNRKGLIGENGIKKEAFFVLQKYYQNK